MFNPKYYDQDSTEPKVFANYLLRSKKTLKKTISKAYWKMLKNTGRMIGLKMCFNLHEAPVYENGADHHDDHWKQNNEDCRRD